MSPHWGVRALLRGGCEQIWGGGAGAQADLERLLLTEGGASAGATVRCSRGSGKGGQESRVRMRGVRAETEQETGVTASKGGRGREEGSGLRFLRNHFCAL